MEGGTSGSSSILGFLIATVVFAVSFATVVQVSIEQGDGSQQVDLADSTAVAASVADLLLSDPGRGWYALGGACVAGGLNASAFSPEHVTRLGLAEERCAILGGPGARQTNLSFEKIDNLGGAQFEDDPDNGYVDYLEAREGLGLADVGVDFHLRTWPVLAGVRRALEEGYKDPNLRPLYVGDYEEVANGEDHHERDDEDDDEGPPILVQHAAGFVADADAVTLYVSITNNGTVDTAFSVTFKVKADREIVSEKHSPLAPVGGSVNVTFLVNRTSDWEWADAGSPRFEFTIRDPSKTVGQGTVSLAGASMTHAQQRHVLAVESGRLEYDVSGGSARAEIHYDALDGTGDSGASASGWSLRLLDGSAAQVAEDNNLKAKGGKSSFTVTTAGVYTAQLRGGADWVAQSDVFHVVADDLGRFTPAAEAGAWLPDASVLPEATYLDVLVDQFDIGVPDGEYAAPDVGFLLGGDVFPDDNRFLADHLPQVLLDDAGAGTLAQYNLVVVGSNVDHDAMTSSQIKNTIKDWVLAGGTLMVFGSGDQAVQWLQPLLHVALESASGGISTPDADNPILKTPNRISVGAYEDWDTAWEFNRDEDSSFFTHVVVKDEDQDVLAVSNPGAYGEGRVILTSWRPYNPTAGDDEGCDPANLEPTCPGLLLVDNFMTLSYEGLFLDYGPAIPADSVQGAQLRIATVYHPEMRRVVELHVIVYVFG